MQIIHLPTGREYACKRFEFVFDDDQRARRLLREMNILKNMVHPCCNRLLCVIPPENIPQSTVPEVDSEELKSGQVKFNEAYLLLRLCDMDLKKLLKSSKHLDET